MSLTIIRNDQLIVIPPEMVAEILSFLSTGDLLKCRQVSQFWNKESIELIKKRGQDGSKIKRAVKLTHTTIKDFVDVMTVEDPSAGIAGAFEWTVSELDVTAELVNCSAELQQLDSHVVSLQRLFGPHCVKSVALSCTINGNFLNYLEFKKLESISRSTSLLKFLNAEDWYCFGDEQRFEFGILRFGRLWFARRPRSNILPVELATLKLTDLFCK